METRQETPSRPDSSPLPPGEPVGMETGYRILSYLAAGLIFYGGLGWLIDRFLGTGFAMPLGLIVGLCLAMYMIVKRYNRPDVMGTPKRNEHTS